MWVGCANTSQRDIHVLKSLITAENGIWVILWVEVYLIKSILGTYKYSLLMPSDFVGNGQSESSKKMNILATHQEYEKMCALT